MNLISLKYESDFVKNLIISYMSEIQKLCISLYLAIL